MANNCYIDTVLYDFLYTLNINPYPNKFKSELNVNLAIKTQPFLC